MRLRPPTPIPVRRRPAFTLLELMIVAGIIALVATMGVPIVYKMWRQEPLRQGVKGILDVCTYARSQAILQNQMTQVIIHPREGRFEFSGAGPTPAANQEGIPDVEISAPVAAAEGTSAKLDENIVIEDLDINKVPGGFREVESAYVRFFPNGTCDELSLVIRYEDHWRQIKLEVSTGLPSIEIDPRKFR